MRKVKETIYPPQQFAGDTRERSYFAWWPVSVTTYSPSGKSRDTRWFERVNVEEELIRDASTEFGPLFKWVVTSFIDIHV